MIIAFSFLSLLKDDYNSSIKEFNNLDNNGWIHFDVMDGKFVENKTFDYKLVKEINTYNKMFSDVHLMIENPNKVIKKYAQVGTDQLTIHYEVLKSRNIIKTINKIKEYGMKVGISIKPNTDIHVLDEFLPFLDYVLIMSVEPGKGGQKFIDSCLDKIKYLKELQNKYHYLIGVDGGINDKTSLLVKEVGVDVIVVGTYLASNLNAETIKKLK